LQGYNFGRAEERARIAEAVKRLREAVETEWENGNVDCQACERILAALEADPLKPRLLGLTRLGLFEIQRPRIQPPLHEVLGLPPSALTHGLIALRRAAREAAAAPGRAWALRANPAVLTALEGLPGALAEMTAFAGRALRLVPDAALSPGRERVEEVG
jgi:hypothetical protein